jgi:hypothetical protein
MYIAVMLSYATSVLTSYIYIYKTYYSTMPYSALMTKEDIRDPSERYVLKHIINELNIMCTLRMKKI